MSFTTGSDVRTIASRVRAWFTHGAEEEKAGLERGWNYLDVSEFAPTQVRTESVTSSETDNESFLTLKKQSRHRTIALDSLSDIVDDLMAETDSGASTLHTTQVLNKRGQRVVSAISGKGGVGKSTVVLGLAGAAATRGKRVLIIDLDPQGSTSLSTLGVGVARNARRAFDDSTIAEQALASQWRFGAGVVEVVPADRSLAQIDQPVSSLHAHSVLAERLGDLSGYDLVLIDAPSTLGTLAFEAVALSHDVLVVTEPSRFGLSSAADAVEFATVARTGRKNWVRTVHVLLNKADGTEESSYRRRELQRNFRQECLATVIDLNEEINYANGAGVVVQHIPGARAKQASATFTALLDELRL